MAKMSQHPNKHNFNRVIGMLLIFFANFYCCALSYAAKTNELIDISANPDRTQPIVIWLAIETKNGNKFLLSTSNTKITTELQQMAKANQVDLLIPLLDLDERLEIDAKDVFEYSINKSLLDALHFASMRYGTRDFLVGKMYQTQDKSWHSEWLLATGTLRVRYHIRAQSISKLLGDLLQEIGKQHLTQNHKVIPIEHTHTIELTVYNIKNEIAYLKLLHYLQHLPNVRALWTSAIDQENITFNLQWVGTMQDLQNQLAKDAVILNKTSLQNNVKQNQLNYQLAV